MCWRPGPWRPCTAACGRGFQSRKVECVRSQSCRPVAERHCVQRKKPASWRHCLGPSCESTYPSQVPPPAGSLVPARPGRGAGGRRGAAYLVSPLTGHVRIPWVSAALAMMDLSPRLTASPHSPSARRAVSSARTGILGIDVYIINILYIHYIVLILYMFMDTRFCIMYIIIVISFL